MIIIVLSPQKAKHFIDLENIFQIKNSKIGN